MSLLHQGPGPLSDVTGSKAIVPASSSREGAKKSAKESAPVDPRQLLTRLRILNLLLGPL